MKVLIIHGPNLNLLGTREPEIYGTLTLAGLNQYLLDWASPPPIAIELTFFQSNHEGAIIDFIHAHRHTADGMVINPGALTHYSYALRDAISAVNLPTVEVHLSDIHQREDFRKISVIAPVCLKQISGLGKNSYLAGLEFLVDYLKNRTA